VNVNPGGAVSPARRPMSEGAMALRTRVRGAGRWRDPVLYRRGAVQESGSQLGGLAFQSVRWRDEAVARLRGLKKLASRVGRAANVTPRVCL